jgi:hypothetical protein
MMIHPSLLPEGNKKNSKAQKRRGKSPKMSVLGLAASALGGGALVLSGMLTDVATIYYPLLATVHAASADGFGDGDGDDDSATAKAHKAETLRWLRYWPIFAAWTLFEFSCEFAVSWLPLYAHLKLALALWLVLPHSDGARTVWKRGALPLIKSHEKRIERALALASPWLKGRVASMLKAAVEMSVGRLAPALRGRGDATSVLASAALDSAASGAAKRLDKEIKASGGGSGGGGDGGKKGKKQQPKPKPKQQQQQQQQQQPATPPRAPAPKAAKSPLSVTRPACNTRQEKLVASPTKAGAASSSSSSGGGGGGGSPLKAETERKKARAAELRAAKAAKEEEEPAWKAEQAAAGFAAEEEKTEEEEEKEPPLHPGWAQATDPSSGRTYYHRADTNETRWTRPDADADALGAWEKTYDEASGKTYFYNPHLEQTTWVRPRDLDSPPLEFDVRGDASADEFELVGGIPNAGSGVTFGEGGRRCSYADFEALRRGASIAQALPPNNAGAEQFPGELAIRLAVWVRETLLKRQALTLAAQDALRVFLGLNERWNGAAGTAEIVLDGVKKLYLWPVCASKGAAQ